MNTLADIIDYNLKILFIGFNPGLRSSATGHHFAGTSNHFWRLLYDSGLTNKKLTPFDDSNLLEFGCGITNIVSRPTKSAIEITKEEYELGREVLKNKLRLFEPKMACYVGIGVYRQFSKLRVVHCGPQTEGVVKPVRDFVVPSSSGLNRIPLKQQLAYFIELKQSIDL